MAPIVREYEADVNPAGPTDTRQARDMDTGNVGNALSRVGAQISDIGEQVHKRDVQSEITDITAKMAQAHAELSDGLDNTLKSKGAADDPDLATKFMQGYDDRMNDIADSATTPEAQQYFERANAQARAHFTMQSMRGQARLKGDKAADDYGTALNSWSYNVAKDPSYFDTAKNLHDQLITHMVDTGLLPEQKGDELRAQGETSLAQAQLKGMIDISPEAAQKELKSGRWSDYFSGDQYFQAEKEVQSGLNAKEIQQERQQAAQQRLQKQKGEAWQNKIAAGIRDGDTSPEFQDAFKNPPAGIPWQDVEAMQKYAKYNQDLKYDTNKGAMAEIYRRIHTDGEDKIQSPGQIYSIAAGLVSPRDTDYLVKELSNKNDPAKKNEAQLKDSFVKMALHQLNPFPVTAGERTPDQQGFLGAFLPEYEKQVAAGKDPVKLLTPGIPGNTDYMGYMIKSMAQTPEQAINGVVNNPKNLNVPANQSAPGSAVAPSVPAPATPTGSGSQGPKGPYGDSVTQGGKTFRWNAKSGKYE